MDDVHGPTATGQTNFIIVAGQPSQFCHIPRQVNKIIPHFDNRIQENHKEFPNLGNTDVGVGATLTERVSIPKAEKSSQDEELTALTELFTKFEHTRLLNITTANKNICQLLHLFKSHPK
jgi:hypothetical protein